MGRMLNQTEGLFANASCGSLEGVELVVTVMHKVLLYFASGKLHECPEKY